MAQLFAFLAAQAILAVVIVDLDLLNLAIMFAAQGSNSRAKLSTLRPARASATIRSLYSVGYGFLVLGMKNTLLHQVKSVRQTGGTPVGRMVFIAFGA
ncbi:hypothetical protein H9Q16_01360 [Sulfitobacter sp. TSTF-M16]|uniref:Uncharacterized protein n=1 Tax=Sulfitobacter aestuariivivens TaxID=2766981 RepID=A0A927D3G2_9RHOB|nr:hypothetical protein [Sulfitobacter aestuariivivens]MBD3662562.1 hypothetical protein [Sulfitobacter aestuariivivens]